MLCLTILSWRSGFSLVDLFGHSLKKSFNALNPRLEKEKKDNNERKTISSRRGQRAMRSAFLLAATFGDPCELEIRIQGRSGASAGILVTPLGERFDRILVRIFQQISQIFANLRGLYLGCIEADFCNQILILQHFSRSIRISFLWTAPNSKI